MFLKLKFGAYVGCGLKWYCFVFGPEIPRGKFVSLGHMSTIQNYNNRKGKWGDWGFIQDMARTACSKFRSCFISWGLDFCWACYQQPLV